MRKTWKATLAAGLLFTGGATVVRAEGYSPGWVAFGWIAGVLMSILGYWLLDLCEGDVRRDERERFEAELRKARLRD